MTRPKLPSWEVIENSQSRDPATRVGLGKQILCSDPQEGKEPILLPPGVRQCLEEGRGSDAGWGGGRRRRTIHSLSSEFIPPMSSTCHVGPSLACAKGLAVASASGMGLGIPGLWASRG